MKPLPATTPTSAKPGSGEVLTPLQQSQNNLNNKYDGYTDTDKTTVIGVKKYLTSQGLEPVFIDTYVYFNITQAFRLIRKEINGQTFKARLESDLTEVAVKLMTKCHKSEVATRNIIDTVIKIDRKSVV